MTLAWLGGHESVNLFLGGETSNTCCVHSDPWGNDPIWQAYFSNGSRTRFWIRGPNPPKKKSQTLDGVDIVCRLASNVSQWSKPKSSPRPRYWKDLTATDLQQLELRVVEGQATLVGARAVISWDHHQVLDTFRISAKKVVKASIGKCVGHFLW